MNKPFYRLYVIEERDGEERGKGSTVGVSSRDSCTVRRSGAGERGCAVEGDEPIAARRGFGGLFENDNFSAL